MNITHLFIAAPICFAVAALLLDTRIRPWILYLFSGVMISLSTVSFYQYQNGSLPPSADAVSLLFVGLTSLTCAAVILVACKSTPRLGRFSALVFATQMGLNLAFIQNSALWFYIGWEAALIPTVLMVFGWGGHGRRSAGMKFLIYTIVGSLGMLASILYLYTQIGTTDWHILSNTMLIGSVQLSVFIGFFIAFAVKVPLFPFHSWQADTYSESNIPTAILLSAVFSKLGIYGFFRLVTDVTPDIVGFLAPTVITLCLIGTVYAAILAFSQSNFKRVLAFASMSHLNLVVAGLFANTTTGISGAIIQATSHVGVTVGLWWVAGIIKKRVGHLRIHEFSGGHQFESKWFTAAFFIILMAAIGFPLTSGFPGEFLLIQSILQHGLMAGIAAALPMVLGGIYMLRVYQALMSGPIAESDRQIALSKVDVVIMTSCLCFIFAIGIYPQLLVRLLTTQLPI